MTPALDPGNLRSRLYGILRSSSFALSDLDRATALLAAIEELIAEREAALRPEPDAKAAKVLPRARGAVKATARRRNTA